MQLTGPPTFTLLVGGEPGLAVGGTGATLVDDVGTTFVAGCDWPAGAVVVPAIGSCLAPSASSVPTVTFWVTAKQRTWRASGSVAQRSVCLTSKTTSTSPRFRSERRFRQPHMGADPVGAGIAGVDVRVELGQVGR